MNKKTLTALKASIAHWRENVDADTHDKVRVGPQNCALCGLFYLRHGCHGCPVFERTGDYGCRGTPYDSALDELHGWRADGYGREEWRTAAQAMLNFLISLLPEGERP